MTLKYSSERSMRWDEMHKDLIEKQFRFDHYEYAPFQSERCYCGRSISHVFVLVDDKDNWVNLGSVCIVQHYRYMKIADWKPEIWESIKREMKLYENFFRELRKKGKDDPSVKTMKFTLEQLREEYKKRQYEYSQRRQAEIDGARLKAKEIRAYFAIYPNNFLYSLVTWGESGHSYTARQLEVFEKIKSNVLSKTGLSHEKVIGSVS